MTGLWLEMRDVWLEVDTSNWSSYNLEVIFCTIWSDQNTWLHQEVVTYRCKSFVTCLYCSKNGIFMPITYTHHTLQQVTHSWVIDILCQPFRELSTSECHHLYRNTCFYYMKKHSFQDHYMNYILFSFFQTHFIVPSELFQDYVLMW